MSSPPKPGQHAPHMDPELPVYSRKDPDAQVQVQHTYDLHKNNRKLLSLMLHSRAKSQDDMPKMHEGQTVSGTVTLNLDGPVFIRSVTVTLSGGLEAPSGVARFLNMRKELYSVESKEAAPPSAGSSPSAAGDRLQMTEDSKLHGTNVFPFAFKLPRGVGIPFGAADGAVSKYLLPASLHEAASDTSIVYQIVVRVKKGMLTSDSRLSTPFEYLPLIRPDAPSLLRQIAYSEGSPVFGPAEDPDGWKTFDVVRVAGTLFKTRPVEIAYTVSLATPTCYTRGAPIHVWVSITASDEQALDLLSSPSATDLRLVCFSSHHETSYTVGMIANSGPLIVNQNDVASAQFWKAPAREGQERLCRELQGEILIPKDLPPGCEILDFALQYAVVLFPPKAPGYALSAHEKARTLLKEDLKIATLYALAPQPLPRSPPEYAMDGQ